MAKTRGFGYHEGMFALLLPACMPILVSDEVTSGAAWEAPTNQWEVNPPPSDLKAEGFDEGEVVPDFRMMDQHGDTVSLWQFYGEVLVLDISTMWCAPCRKLAEGAQAVADEYRDQGFRYLTVFPEDADGSDQDPVIPDLEDLSGWGEYYELTEPLLSDADGYSKAAVKDSYPVVLVIDRKMQSTGKIEPAEESAIVAKIKEAL